MRSDATGNIPNLRRRGWPNSEKVPSCFPGFAQQTFLEVFRRLMWAALVESVWVSVVRGETVEEISKEMSVVL